MIRRIGFHDKIFGTDDRSPVKEAISQTRHGPISDRCRQVQTRLFRVRWTYAQIPRELPQ